jgi:tripartite-type tricarboxylate transporter receptor subunit TctC
MTVSKALRGPRGIPRDIVPGGHGSLNQPPVLSVPRHNLSGTRMTMLRSVLAVLALLLYVGAAPSAVAQNWPTKPVKVIAVFPAGGSVDQVARILAQQLTEQTGQSFIVDNRGGASGSIGTAALAKAEPDGYTIGVVFDTHAVNPTLIPGLPFDTLRDLTPLMLVGTGAMALVTPVAQPYKSFADVVAAAKAKPGGVSYGTIGAGSLGHLAMTQLGNQLGVEFNHIPYRGGGPLMNDAIGNQVPLAIGSVFLVNPHIASGRVRAIAVTSAKPDPKLPNVPTIASQGVPGFAAYTWWAVFGPPNMPPALVKRVYDELAKAVKATAVTEKLSAQGMEVTGAPPDQLDAFVRAEIPRWAKVIKENNIKSGD